MAGIIVGNDTATGTKGIAPGAKLTSIKLGTANGAVDVSQVIAAIDWVVEHRNDDPANPIRVLNLSYGTGGNPAPGPTRCSSPSSRPGRPASSWSPRPATTATAPATLANPATDPFVIAVGAAATKGTAPPPTTS